MSSAPQQQPIAVVQINMSDLAALMGAQVNEKHIQPLRDEIAAVKSDVSTIKNRLLGGYAALASAGALVLFVFAIIKFMSK
jgi:hypothetical protein